MVFENVWEACVGKCVGSLSLSKFVFFYYITITFCSCEYSLLNKKTSAESTTEKNAWVQLWWWFCIVM